MLNSLHFCQCGNLFSVSKMYFYCRTCEHLRYKIGRYTLIDEPPVFTERGIALAAIRITSPDFMHEEWEKFSSLEDAFEKAEGCLPNHLSRLRSNYLLMEYLDAITDLMIHEPVAEKIDWTIEMNNARTAVMSIIKRCLYGDSQSSVEFNPMKEGKYSNIAVLLDKRVKSIIESMSEYMDSIHCCLDCGAIGEKMILLPGSRLSLDGCSDCN